MNPCVPSQCGPYSICKIVNEHGVCSCQEGYVGSPPTCRPECVASTDCPQHQACIKQKCRDPCPGTCGLNARCQVINHNPICTCKAGFTGDPFITCQLEQSKNLFIINEIKSPSDTKFFIKYLQTSVESLAFLFKSIACILSLLYYSYHSNLYMFLSL